MQTRNRCLQISPEVKVRGYAAWQSARRPSSSLGTPHCSISTEGGEGDDEGEEKAIPVLRGTEAGGVVVRVGRLQDPGTSFRTSSWWARDAVVRILVLQRFQFWPGTAWHGGLTEQGESIRAGTL
jgi:hypothetical protein